LGEALQRAPDVEALKLVLRQRRNAVMLHIIWRDLNRHAQLSETTASVTRIADQFIDGALAWMYESAIAEAGEPIGADSGAPQRLVVVALGNSAPANSICPPTSISFCVSGAGHES
jgi:glutamate-ammonia-ligase adenylyltransferase